MSQASKQKTGRVQADASGVCRSGRRTVDKPCLPSRSAVRRNPTKAEDPAKPVIPAGMPESIVHGWQTGIHDKLGAKPGIHILVTGCIWDILVPHPSGGEAVQIGCPADLSGVPARNDGFSLIFMITMQTPPIINTAWHPLASGNPPAWASEWGQDEYGVFVAFTLEKVTQRLRWIPPGRFMMGSLDGEPGRLDHEGPQHPVFITRGFWLFDTPCTQALWETVMGGNPSHFKSPRRPVEQVSWDQVRTFLHTINAKLPGLDLCLPTDAQWEHACRARTDTAMYSGPIEILGERNAPALNPIAWYGGNSGEGYELDDGWDSSSWTELQHPNPKSGTREVGQKQPNPWGLYDMLGNVWEWCADGMRTYSKETQIDPIGTMDAGAGRVLRSGSWNSFARSCRSASRSNGHSGGQYYDFGFRCARVQS